ncbi:MAG TPA: serine/threonine-protein kinase [Polyangiales bacterium]|nr:serine/threonine-protein kinase [Polyangiales bacterium]
MPNAPRPLDDARGLCQAMVPSHASSAPHPGTAACTLGSGQRPMSSQPPPPPTDSVRPPHGVQRIGPYEVVRRLGKGGMGETFLVHLRGPGGFTQRLCVKRMLPAPEDKGSSTEDGCEEGYEQGNAEDYFLDEARVLAMFDCDRIVRPQGHPARDDAGVWYFAMEYVDGVDLGKLLSTSSPRRDPLPPELAIEAIYDAATALEHAHALKIIHRDFSPSNLLTRIDGTSKLLDFGIAAYPGRQRHTGIKLVKGKPEYMSPEQARGQELTTASDIFSLGSVAYQALSGGHSPFRAGADIPTLLNITQVSYTPLDERVPELSPDIVQLVHDMLQADPTRRPTAGQVRERLEPHRARHARKELGARVAQRLSSAGGLNTPSIPLARPPSESDQIAAFMDPIEAEAQRIRAEEMVAAASSSSSHRVHSEAVPTPTTYAGRPSAIRSTEIAATEDPRRAEAAPRHRRRKRYAVYGGGVVLAAAAALVVLSALPHETPRKAATTAATGAAEAPPLRPATAPTATIPRTEQESTAESTSPTAPSPLPPSSAPAPQPASSPAPKPKRTPIKKGGTEQLQATVIAVVVPSGEVRVNDGPWQAVRATAVVPATSTVRIEARGPKPSQRRVDTFTVRSGETVHKIRW